MSDTVEFDNCSDLAVTVAAVYEDPSVADALREMYECEAAVDDADLAAMAAAAEADGLDPAPFGDLTSEKCDELMRFFPTGYGWMPQTRYAAGSDKPFVAELTRPTPNGPDVAHVGEYTCAESALRSAVWFANAMLLAQLEGTEEDKAAIRAKITYAKR